MAEHLDVRDFHNGRNLFEAGAEDLQQYGHCLLYTSDAADES